MKKLRQFIEELQQLEQQYPYSFAQFDVVGATTYGRSDGRRVVVLKAIDESVVILPNHPAIHNQSNE